MVTLCSRIGRGLCNTIVPLKADISIVPGWLVEFLAIRASRNEPDPLSLNAVTAMLVLPTNTERLTVV
jgi:hypothetical protein